jgi:choloylglycine hydrolase
VVDLTNLRFFFELTTSPNVVWLDQEGLDLSEGAPVLVLDPDDIRLSGEVSAHLRAADHVPF